MAQHKHHDRALNLLFWGFAASSASLLVGRLFNVSSVSIRRPAMRPTPSTRVMAGAKVGSLPGGQSRKMGGKS